MEGRNTRSLGTAQETIACAFLEAQGYEILKRNYHNRMGEIDIVAKDHGVLVFVEVKYRSGEGAGRPGEAVGYRKQLKITKTAQYYLMEEVGCQDVDCRFDVVSIYKDQVELIANAFEAVGLS